MENEEAYWSNRYKENRTGWDIGYPSTPLKEYVDQLKNKEVKILIPGAGNAYEAEYIFSQGFTNVYVLDISPVPLKALKSRVPDFPNAQLLQEDFFGFKESFDLILEQTFFCSFEPSQENRSSYAAQMHDLLRPGGKLVGVWFDHPLKEDSKRPFGGTQEEYEKYFSPYFEIKTFEKCKNSIKPRMGFELFGIFIKKKESNK